MATGLVRTPVPQKCTILPVAPGYEDPSNPAAIGRRVVASARDPSTKVGHLRRTMEKIYALSSVRDPPLRLVIGSDALGAVRAHLKRVQEGMEGCASWSEGVKEE